VAIDLSEDGPRVVALVGAREHVLKSSRFLRACKWVKHFREIGSDRKSSYLSAFPKRFEKLRPFLDIVRICLDAQAIQRIIDELGPRVVIVDDKLYNEIQHLRKVRESRVKERHRKVLTLIADNLANYFRLLLKSDPRRFREELERFEK